ncbi:MAG: branched-chain amino acid transport system / permease component family protein [Bacillota bacterium]|jgi:ribose transport system permease protein|nr:branched-chain amino acid transport system / permease component family protein [Bacillota bacterium]
MYERLPNPVHSVVSTLKKSTMTAIGAVLALMILMASIFSPYFLDIYNLQSLIRDLAFIGMIGIGQSLLLIIGELDLSVGKIASLCGILSGIMMMHWGWNSYLSLLAALFLGLVLGSLNGLIISKLRLNAMVATIGMAGVYGGVNLVLTKGKAITGIPSEIHIFGKGNLGPLPIPFIFTLIVLVLVLFFVKKTKTGRYIYAIGNNRDAARVLGIKVDRIRILIYSIVGMISALAGILYVARLGSAQSAIGENWPMNSIAASVIGGVALTGGIGNPAGALIGAAIISVIQNMIILFGVNVYWQSAVSGFVVVIAISFSSLSVILQERKQRKIKLSK